MSIPPVTESITKRMCEMVRTKAMVRWNLSMFWVPTSVDLTSTYLFHNYRLHSSRQSHSNLLYK
jgi:hypothetical protein